MISDTVAVALIAGIGGVFTTISTIVLAWMQRDTKRAVTDVTESAGDQLGEIAKVGKDTHALVNSERGALLKEKAVALRRVADFTQSPDDIAAADDAEAAAARHFVKQAIVDARP